MSLSYGFYNSVDHDRVYSAIDFSKIFDGIIRDGVFATVGSALKVSEATGMTVNVGTGRAWFNHTWTYNDSILPVTCYQSDLTLDRIDALVLEINQTSTIRANSIKMVKGPLGGKTKPTMAHTETVDQYALAYITIRANTTRVTQSDIENAIGSNETPYVTGILSVVSAEQLYSQWQSQFEDVINNDADQFNEQLSNNSAVFETWFNNLRYILDGDVAGNLQNQIDTFKNGTRTNVVRAASESVTRAGVKIVNNGDGTYTLDGTATANVWFSVDQYEITDSNKRVKMVGCPPGGSLDTYYLYTYKEGSSAPAYDTGLGVEFDCNQKTIIGIAVPSGSTVSNLLFKPMVTSDLTATYTDFVPFTGHGKYLNQSVADVFAQITPMTEAAYNALATKESKLYFTY